MINLFQLGQEGLNAAQAQLDITANNIANLNTPGYHRQYVDFSTGGPNGMGVTISGIGQQLSMAMTRQLQEALSRQGDLKTQTEWLGGAVSDLDSSKLGDQFNQYYTAASSLANHPGDSGAQANFAALADQLSHSLTQQLNDLSNSQQNAQQRLQDDAGQLNAKAKQLSELNKQIQQARASSGDEPLALLDQREQLLNDMHQLADVKVVQQDGDYNIYLKNGDALVLGNRQIDVDKKAYSQISGGEMGGINNYLQQTLPKLQDQLQQIAKTFADETNQAFSDVGGKPLFELQKDRAGNVTGLQFNKDNFNQFIKGDSSQGIAPATPESIEKFAHAVSQLQSQGNTIKQYRDLVSEIGGIQAQLKGSLDAQNTATMNISQAIQQQSGVDENTEAVNMSQFTRYFQANSQIIQTANTLFDTILSLH